MGCEKYSPKHMNDVLPKYGGFIIYGFYGVEQRKKRFIYVFIVEGSLEVKLPTIWTDEKQSREEAERRGRLEERRVEEKE